MIPGAIPLVKTEFRPGVYVLMDGDVVRYVGASQDPWTRAKSHRIHIPHDRVLFVPVRGSRHTLMEVERCFIVQFQPTHNRKDNPAPQIEESVTTVWRDSVLWRLWTNRDMARGIRRAAKQSGKTPLEWIRQSLLAAVESARSRGLGIKPPPAPRDGRRTRAQA